MRDRYREGEIELELIDMLASEKHVALLVCERFHGSRRAHLVDEALHKNVAP
ncbi:MAG: hypothetical protein ABW135_03445 [Thermoleophilaceae bacterium]